MPGYEWIGDVEREQVNQVFDTGILFRYEFDKERKGVYKVKEFESEFAHFHGVKYSHAVTSGSAALKVGLAALGVKPGDEVITQGFTFIATFEAIIEAGAIPVPAEIDETLNMDPDDLKKKITPRTKAVIPVHMLGSPAKIREIVDIARDNGLRVLEDTAQALAASVQGKKLGAWGDLGTFSFDFYKTLTTGEGGMIITDDEQIYVRASEYADHGHDHNPSVSRALEGRNFLGFNYRMNEIQGAIGLAQLGRIDAILQRQTENQSLIRETLVNLPNVKMREIPDGGLDSHTHVCFLLSEADKAVKFHKHITNNGVSAIYFKNNFWHFLPNWEHIIEFNTAWPGKYPLHSSVYEGNLRYSADMLPRSSDIMSRLVVIPISLGMNSESVRRTIVHLKSAAEELL
jgi:8-amino-3,8-dideoxy-alpha-D-manno-octulosonate transaminase